MKRKIVLQATTLLFLLILMSMPLPTSGVITVGWKRGDKFKLTGYNSVVTNNSLNGVTVSNGQNIITLNENYRINDVSKVSQSIVFSRPPYNYVNELNTSYSLSTFEDVFLSNFGLTNDSSWHYYYLFQPNFLSPSDFSPYLKSRYIYLLLFVKPDWQKIGENLSYHFNAKLKPNNSNSSSALYNVFTAPNSSFVFCGATTPSDIQKVLNQDRRSWNYKFNTKVKTKTTDKNKQALIDFSYSFDLKYTKSGMLDSYKYTQIEKTTMDTSVSSALPPGNLTTTVPQLKISVVKEIGLIRLNGSSMATDSYSGILNLLGSLNHLDVGSLVSLLVTVGLIVILMRVRKRFPGKIKRVIE